VQQLRVSIDGLRAAADLFDDDRSIPFVARYCKAATGGLEERQLRRLHAVWREATSAAAMRDVLRNLLEERGQWSSTIATQLGEIDSAARLRSLLSLIKRRKLPRAVMEQRRAWYPLAHRVLAGSLTQSQLDEALHELVTTHQHLESATAARELLVETIAESISDRPDIRQGLTAIIEQSATVTCSPHVEPEVPEPACDLDTAAPTEPSPPLDTAAATDASPTPDISAIADKNPANVAAAKPKKTNDASAERRQKRRSARRQKRDQLESKFKHLLGLEDKLSDLTTRQIIELEHGDRVRAICFDIKCDEQVLLDKRNSLLQLGEHEHRALIEEALATSVAKRLIPELLKECKRDLCNRAAHELRGQLAHSLRARALQRPTRCCVLALHAKLRWGWQAVVLDANGNVIANEAIPWNQGADGDGQLAQRIRELAKQNAAHLVALGDSPGARKLDRLFAANEQDGEFNYVMVDTSGIMDLARSGSAAQLFREKDPHIRAAVAVGQRLRDPLTALIPVPTKDLYATRPELKTFLLLNEEALADEIVSCLCIVGVDVNTASAAVLTHVPGIDKETADKIAARRATQPFANREQVRQAFADERAYAEAIGFLHVFGGDNPLDATDVHPDHYAWADAVLTACQLDRDDLTAVIKQRTESLGKLVDEPVDDTKWLDGLKTAQLRDLAQQLEADPAQLKQVLIALRHAGNDIRRNSAGPVLRGKKNALTELKPGTELAGTVMNIVDFGVFVDVGRAETGLVHISRLANGFIRNSRDFVWEGDPIRVWVVSIDESKNRLALTAIAPGISGQRGNGRSAAKAPRWKSPRRGDRSSQKSQGRKSSAVVKHKKKPKSAAPITDAMREGSEPMRAFSDLLQFYKSDGEQSESGKDRKK
jgi:uncharacterized protein